jgi:hypothetical protein
MFVCCDCCVLSGGGLCDGLITPPEESYRLWRVVVCDQETSKTRRPLPATGLWKIQPHWVVTSGKQTTYCHLVSNFKVDHRCVHTLLQIARHIHFFSRRHWEWRQMYFELVFPVHQVFLILIARIPLWSIPTKMKHMEFILLALDARPMN